ncbi:MAG: hypothetical protein WBI25_03955 [Smithellaceae bacterium]|mgnify:CR=1 FL=1|jgi:hypothetical protein
MKNQREILNELQNVKKATSLYLAQEPEAEDLKWVADELTRIEKLILNNWPLSADNKKTIEIGVYGARNLHELENAKLAVMLSKLDAQLKNS